MRIAQVWKNDYPWDVRVEKICKTLIDDGHEVHLICSNTKKQKTRENLNSLQIYRLPYVTTNLLNRIFSMPVFFNPLWIYQILKVVRNQKIEAIIVRDLPLILAGIFAAKICKIPVVFDMAENYPALWKEHVSRKGIKFFNVILKNHKLAEIMENYALKKADYIIVVVEESKTRILKKGIPGDKVSIVSNTPDLSIFDNKGCNKNNSIDDEFKLLYVGGVESPKRGVETVIRSIPLLHEDIDNLSFSIVGDGAYLGRIKEFVKTLGIERNINFKGRISYDLMIEFIDRSDVCVVPHFATEHVNSTIPNKLFEYMARKKPVIVSDAAPLKRIVEENNSGVVFRSGDERSFAEKVLELKSPAVRFQLGENGYRAVNEKYNWDRDSQNLREIFNKVQKGEAKRN